jgi:predicted dienelactone hydrolase
VILFSHGHYGDPRGCSRLCGALAADGFAVIAPRHADRGTPLNLQAVERVDDLTFVLDHLRWLAPRADARRIGVAGHSFGGRTAAELAGQDPRVKALMTMAGGADRGTTALITAPTLMVAGSADTVDPVRLSAASLRALPRATPKRLLVIPGAGHGDLVDGCTRLEGACERIARAAAGWFERALG